MAKSAPYMRLVGDHAPEELESFEQQTADVMPEMPETDETQGDQPQTAAPKRRRRRNAAPQAAPDVADGANERPDGQVVDATDEASDLPNEPMDAESVAVDLGALEALLFSTQHPLTAGRLAEMLELDTTRPLRAGIKQLNEQYEQTNRSFRIEQVAGGYQLLTLPQHGEMLKRLHQKEVDAKLTKAALETLAIVAYKQPILRVDVEAIRGVACGETIRSLMEKHLVKIAGRAEEPGRPILYGTTKRFLELFGLNSLKDLPQAEGIQAPKSIPPAADEQQAESA
jgi:segregation and condensation protein B